AVIPSHEGILFYHFLDPHLQGDDNWEGCHSLILFLSFPRMRESSFTIFWIPFYKGMTTGRAVIP
ncbi:MAG: hypothetical protein SFT68_03280, partial [Rickettsiaceae bacterium]|nr:hypothetical protein [Rickettsiaceae bacterium]